MNYDMKNPQTVTVSLDAQKKYKLTRQLETSEATVSNGNDNRIAVDLIAGGAALIVIE